MFIGVPKEIKTHEYRVGLVPSSVKEIVSHGHKVLVETNAGNAINFTDDDYRQAGAEIASNAKEVFDKADMIVKVKEPQAAECAMLRENQLLFTYLHLAADKPQAEGLMKSGCVAIAYETVTDNNGGLPLLAPMSEIAGRLSIQVGSYFMQKHCGGLGKLISGVPGVAPSRVLVIGGGVSGFNAARMAVGMESHVRILERNPERMRFLDNHFSGSAEVLYSSQDAVERAIQDSDIVIGAVLIPGAAAPNLITREMLSMMRPGTTLVDISIDQGGCFETSKPTTHADPVYMVDDILHYCVANMPGAVPHTSALHLNNAILPYVIKLANNGWEKALANDPHLQNGLNVKHGIITCPQVAQSLDLPLAA